MSRSGNKNSRVIPNAFPGGGVPPLIGPGGIQPVQPSATPATGIAPPSAVPASIGVTTSSEPNVMQTSAGLFNRAAAGPDINKFMNQYTGMATDQAMQGLERQRQVATNDVGLAATRAGAFGGSRHGIADAQTNEAFARQGAGLLADMYHQGFGTAVQAAQGQQGIDSGLAAQGFGFGQKIADQQWQQGQAQREINQRLIDDARGQYSSFSGAPSGAMGGLWDAISRSNMGQNTVTEKKTLGLADIIAAGASAYSSIWK